MNKKSSRRSSNLAYYVKKHKLKSKRIYVDEYKIFNSIKEKTGKYLFEQSSYFFEERECISLIRNKLKTENTLKPKTIKTIHKDEISQFIKQLLCEIRNDKNGTLILVFPEYMPERSCLVIEAEDLYEHFSEIFYDFENEVSLFLPDFKKGVLLSGMRVGDFLVELEYELYGDWILR